MKRIAIVGAGGLGREVALLISQLNKVNPLWTVSGFYDDNVQASSHVDGYHVLGKVEDLNAINEEIAVVVAVASPMVRKEIVNRISNPNVQYPTIVHPNVNLGHKENYFGQGCIITEGCILTTGVRIEDFVIINLASTMGHDVVLGQFTAVMPGCHISGNVKIGGGSLLGTGACVLQNITLGKQTIVGAGAVVTKSFPDGAKLLGVPAINVLK